jgi:hypothetical protein
MVYYAIMGLGSDFVLEIEILSEKIYENERSKLRVNNFDRKFIRKIPKISNNFIENKIYNFSISTSQQKCEKSNFKPSYLGTGNTV